MPNLKERIQWLENAFPGRKFVSCSCGAVIDSKRFLEHSTTYPNINHKV